MNPIRVLTFDVQHGNCHAIWSPSGKLIVIDLGRSDEFAPVEWLKSQGIGIIDLLVLTHPHDDHIRGFRDLDGMEIKILHRPKNIPTDLTAELDQDLQRNWNNFDTRYTGPVLDSQRFYDATASAFDGLSLRFFGGQSSSANLNNYSIVTVLEYAGLKIVFPGDLENQGWLQLLEDVNFKAAITGANILVSAHHGREAGWCPELFDHISPHLIIVSDGASTETSYSSQYSAKAKGAKVKAKNTNEVRDRNLVSTRDNGHIDINVSARDDGWEFTVDVDTH